MSPFLTTSNRVKALVQGGSVALAILGFLWAVGLPLQWKFCAILIPVIGIASSAYFYDRSADDRRCARPAQILMKDVYWNFASGEIERLDEFIARVGVDQPTNTTWNPDQKLPIRGPVEIELVRYDLEEPSEQVLRLQPATESGWTQSTLLHELHTSLLRTQTLADSDSTFFEGLAKCGAGRYRLFLGS